jgi:hypothetical protein
MEAAETFLDLLCVPFERGHGHHLVLARRLEAAHETGRTEMSDAVADLMQRYLGVEPLFGWEARIVSLAVEMRRLRQRAEAAEALVAKLQGACPSA